VIRQRFFFGHYEGIQHNHVLKLSSRCLETVHLLSGFGAHLRPVLRSAGAPARSGGTGWLKFAHKKIGGKRNPLAAIGIDFNRILLSA
jgi:hypothetical protein